MEHKMSELEALSNKFSIAGHVVFEQADNGLISINVKTAHATCCIQLQGAHITHWAIDNQPDVIWLSDDAVFAKARSLRGGIPICWPWFGAHVSDASLPAHGFARTVNWQLKETSLAGEKVKIVFALQANKTTEAMWPYASELEYTVMIGQTLELDLRTRNTGQSAMTIGEALHTYFNVSDVSKVTLSGLDDCDYLDKVEGFKRKHQTGPVMIDQEVDRVYLDTADDCVIEDPGYQRRIVIKKQGSHSTVVWNPWRETAEKMGDLGKDGYLNMLCVESANAAENVVSLAPGEQHRLWVEYSILT